MLLKISLISLIVSVFFFLIYLIRCRRKKSGFLRKASGLISMLAIIVSAVFFIVFIKSNNISFFNRVKSYDILKQYTETLNKNGEQVAYPLLPDGLFSQGDNLYFKNGKNDLFEYRVNDKTQGFVTAANKTVYLGGGKTLKATITSKGVLVLDGYFMYSEYDGELMKYSNTAVAENVVSCTATSNSLMYITENGDLYAMGFNEYGQLGDNTTQPKQSPVFIMHNVKTASVCDTHSMIIDKYGTLYAVGDNSYSQLGNRTAVSSNEIIRIMQGVKDVRVGNYYTLVLAVNGEVYVAGTNKQGQLGNNGGDFKAELISLMTGVKKIDCCHNTLGALTFDGKLYTWGDNINGKAGANGSVILAKPLSVYDNVYDFTITNSSVGVLTRNRDIFLSDGNGGFNALLSMGAVVPEQYITGDSQATNEAAA